MSRIHRKVVRTGLSICLILTLSGLWLGPSRAQTPVLSFARLMPAQPPRDGALFVPSVVLVRLAASLSRTTDAAQYLGVEAGALSPLMNSGQHGLYRLTVPQGTELANAARISTQADVLYAEPDYLFFAAEMPPAQKIMGAVTPDDSLYERYQWNLRHIRANIGWERTTGSNRVVIAVVDTGVDLGHPDLAEKIVGGIDTVNNDFVPQDDHGHGTHVASIAAAVSNNGAGITGLDWNARIMPVKVLDAEGSGSSSSVANGIVWATDNGADIINLSMSGTSPSLLVQTAVRYAYDKGVLVIAAAGNSYKNGNPTSYPAAYPHVLGVAAVNDTDGHASYSNSGSYVDVAAPGGDPLSPFDNDSRHWILGADWQGSGSSYAWHSGTSQAVPQVAGLAGLLLALNSALTPDQLTQLITGSAVDVQAAGWDMYSGYGRIDVAAALGQIPPPATDTPTPTATVTPTASPTPTITPTPTPTPPARSRADVRVNSVETDAQFYPALAIDGQNNLTAIWRDRRSGVETLYSAGMAANDVQWGANLPLTGTATISATGSKGSSGLAAGADGLVAAVWHDNSDGDSDIFSSRFGKDTNSWSEPDQVNSDLLPPVSQRNPTISLAEDGVLVAVWEDGRSAALASAAPQLYWNQTSDERSSWGLDQPVAPSANAQSAPRLAVGSSTAYLVWVERGSGADWLMFARRALSDASWTTKPIEIISGGIGRTLAAPDIVADRAGNLLVVWQEDLGEEPLGTAIYSVWRSASEVWDVPVRIGSQANGVWQSSPRLAANDQEVALVWRGERNEDGDIYVSWTTRPKGGWLPEKRVNQDAGIGNQFWPDVAIDQWGNTTVVWSDDRGGESAPDVYSRFIPAGERFRLFLPVLKKP